MKGLRAHWLTLALVAAAALTGVLAYSTRDSVTTSELAERKSNLFPVWREDEITRIEITRPGERVVLEREPGDGGEPRFRLLEPWAEPADAVRVDKLIGSLGFATPLRKLDAGSDRTAYGLGEPRWEIAVHMGALSYRLRVGKAAETPKGAAYVEVSDARGQTVSLSLLAKDLLAELDVRADALRETKLVQHGITEISKVALTRGDQSVRLSADKGRFRLDEPQLRADRDRVELLFVELARLDAVHFLDPAAAEAAQKGADVLQIELTPEQQGSPPVKLVLGGRCPAAEGAERGLGVARRLSPSPRAACVRLSFFEKLALSREEFVDRFAFSLRTDEVEELRLEQGDKKLVLARKGSRFLLRAPSEAEVALDAGNRRIEAVSRGRGEIVPRPDENKLGLNPPRARATLSSGSELGGDVRTETVSVGARTADGGVYVRRDADGAVLTLPAETARALLPDATLLKPARVLEFTQSSFVSLEVTWREGKQRLTRSPDGTLHLELPKGFEHDGPLAVDLLQALGALDVERWVADADDGSFGLGTPELTAQIAFESGDGGTRNEKLVVGDRTSGGHYARLESDPGVFILGREVVESLSTLLVDRSPFMVAADDVRAIELEARGKKYELSRRGSELESSTLSASQVRRITDVLGSLRAEAAVHTGPPAPAEGFDRPILVVRALPIDAGRPVRTLRIGKADSYRDMAVYFARADGSDATYVIAQSKIRPILDAL